MVPGRRRSPPTGGPALTPTLDDLLGAALALIRDLRAAGWREQAGDLLAALTGGCSAPELVSGLRAELLGLPGDLPEGLAATARDLAGQLTGWLVDEGY